MKDFLKEWGRPIGITIGAVICFFLLIKLCFPGIAPNLEQITFENNSEVHVLYTYPSGCEGEDITLSAVDGRTILSALNACGGWTSDTCDCAGGVVIVIGEGKLHFGGEGVRWLGDHFHYIGEDLCVDIPEKHQEKLEKILSPYWDRE